MNRSRISLAGLVALILLGLTSPAWRRSLSPSSPTPLVVYCAHDAVFSEQILRDFERRTGIPVEIRFDTEATKSLGLVNLIVQEAAHPRCDVFWNNQVLSTLELQQRGLLEPYRGPGFDRIPARFKDADGHWAGFAARLRVFIVNVAQASRTLKLPLPPRGEGRGEGQPIPDVDSELRTGSRLPLTPDPSPPPGERGDVDELAAISSPDQFDHLPAQLNHWAIAKPLFGTTNTHYALLWHLWGEEKLTAWHRELRRRGIREVPGNGSVKNLVAEGVCQTGFTDTDDFFEAKDEGKPVTMRPVLVNDRAICIPNSVVIIRGSKNIDAARRLVDFLLSAENELALANSAARQVPLGPVDESKLAPEVIELRRWVDNAHDVADLLPAQEACLRWLKSESLRGE